MLDEFIINELKRLRREQQPQPENRPQLEIPIYEPQGAPVPLPEEPRGVVVIDLYPED